MEERKEREHLEEELQIITKGGGSEEDDFLTNPLPQEIVSSLDETIRVKISVAKLRLKEAEVDQKRSKIDHRRSKIDLKRSEVKDREQDRSERKKFAIFIFLFLVVYILWVMVVICGSGYLPFAFHLSDNLLIALITTTTANIISIFAIVTKYLFPKKGKNNE